MKPQAIRACKSSLHDSSGFLVFILVVLLSSLFSRSVFAQMSIPSPGAVITVHVQDDAGGPVDVQAMVHITGVDTLTNLVEPTREGIATFHGVQGSEFNVEVTAPGFDSVHEDIVISGRTGTNDQFVEMHRHAEGTDGKRSRPAVPLLTGKTRAEVDAAVEALRSDNAEKAAPHIDYALKHAPADPNVQYYAGIYSQKIKDLPAARQHFETAIAIYPDHYGAQLDLGSLLLQLQNDAAGAIPHFEKAISLQPESWLAHWLEAEADLRMHDPASAKTHAGRAIELGKEKSAGAAVTLARAQAMAGDRDGARKTLEEFVRKYPQDGNVGRAQALLNSPAFAPAANTSHPNN